MQHSRRIRRHIIKAVLRPLRSATEPQIEGAVMKQREQRKKPTIRFDSQSPWIIIYTVTVKLILSIDSWKASANVGIAGKYMLAVNGLVPRWSESDSRSIRQRYAPEKTR